jgi:quercetin dioxygenase-like cupin family protein
MPVHKLGDLKEELVTPRHSSALGQLVTGEQVELGVLRYKAGEGANEHAHPQEQIFLVLSGRVRMTIAGRAYELGPREVAHLPPNVPHRLEVLEDCEVVSAKGIVGGLGHRI